MEQISFWVLALLGLFYAVLGTGLIRRSRKHSCRTCLYWQACLARNLGLSGTGHERCAEVRNHS